MIAKGYRGQTEAAKVPPPAELFSDERAEYGITYQDDPETLYPSRYPDVAVASGATLWRRTIVRTYGPWEKVN